MYLQLEGVSKIYHKGPVEVRALDQVDLSIERGEFLVLWGVSGSGKSTLLNLVGGLDHPTSGKVEVEGRSLERLDSDALADYRREHIGFIFQSFNLIPSLTVLENVTLPLAPLRLSGAEKRRRSAAAVEQVGLTARASHLPGELSGGEQQRVAIARALVNNPEVILADEPTSDLDTATGERIIDLLEEMGRQGRTVILATHDPRIRERAAHRVIMQDGRIVERA